MATAALSVTPELHGIVHGKSNPPGTLEELNRLLQKNHETYHIFFRPMGGMNHISHSILTCYALGASPQQLQDRYHDEGVSQKPMPPLDVELLEKLDDPEIFSQNMYVKAQYQTFLRYFERKITASGWKAVVHEFLFSRSRIATRMLCSMFDGLFHPLIHLGLAIEFDLPGLAAEALAQAATNDDSDIEKLFAMCETEALAHDDRPSMSILQLVDEVRASEEIRTAPRWSDLGLKLRNGLVARGGEAFAQLAGRFRIAADEDELARRTAEMMSTCAHLCGAAQFPGKKTKIDFFWMHEVTASLFMSLLAKQRDWISLEDRVLLMERKVRTDLAWYACCGSPPLDENFLPNYSSPESDGWSWDDLYQAVLKEHDDGHAAKFIRACKYAEETCAEFENGEWGDYLPVKGDMWLKLARMCHDTTKNTEIDFKWIRFTGFPEGWQRPDLLN